MKTRTKQFLAAAAFAATALAGTAKADTIDFTQFGGPGTFLGGTISGTTKAGVGFTITAPNVGAVFIAVEGGATAFSIGDNFAAGSDLLNVLFPTGPITINFATGISSISGLALEATNYGPETETLTAYSGATLLGSDSVSQTVSNNPGTITGFSFSGTDITQIVLTTTGGGADYDLGNAPPPLAAGVPEPATWAMMLAGFGAIGFALRRKPRAAMAAV